MPLRRRNPLGAWRLRAISSLLVVDDVPASTPPHALSLPHKPHARDLLYFYHGLLEFSAVIALILPVVTAPRARSVTLQAEPAAYAGMDTCRKCHPDAYESYQKSVHFRAVERDGTVLGCETCHGPGAPHADSFGEKSLLFDPDEIFTVEQKIEPCLKCHGGNEKLFDYRSSDHARGSIACSDCHKPHEGAVEEALIVPVPGVRSSALDAKAGHESCLVCHEEIRASIQLNEAHHILEGMVRCSDCHEQHGVSSRARLGGFKQEACFRCHSEKRGPHVFEHPASRIEGCTACHSPHGSVNRHLLAFQNTADLCFSCHTAVPGFHSSFNRTTNCVNCHAAIHGSQINPFFLR